MDIAEVAKQTGVPASTLRFYEQRGLISSNGRHGLRRLFGPDVIERLALIGLGQTAGFSLDEIAGMLTRSGKPAINRAALSARAEALDANIRRLSAMRDALRHAAVCPARSHLECPTFRRLLKVQSTPAVAERRRRSAGRMIRP